MGNKKQLFFSFFFERPQNSNEELFFNAVCCVIFDMILNLVEEDYLEKRIKERLPSIQTE